MRQCNVFFELAQVRDEAWQAHFASSRLTEHAAIWLQTYPHSLGTDRRTWSEFTADLLAAFTPQDYAFFTRTQLDKCTMRGSDVRGYVRAFRQKLNRC